MHPSVWTAAAMEKISPSGPRVSHLDNNIPLVFAAKKKRKKKKQSRASSRARDSTLARLLAHQGVAPVPFSHIVIFEKLVKTGQNYNNRSILICKRRLQSPRTWVATILLACKVQNVRQSG